MEGVTRRILVTGTSGVLGDAVATGLEAAGHTVTRHHGRADGDLATAAGARAAIEASQPDAVVNTAGLTYGDAAAIWTANAVIPIRLADAISTLQPGARLVLASSAAVYGLPEAGDPIREGGPVAPNSDYGLAKLAAERLTGALCRMVIAARVFNIITTDADPRSLLARVRMAYDAGEAAPRGADAVRDWVTPQFVGETLARLAVVPHSPSVVNVCSGVGKTPAELLGRSAVPDLSNWSVGDPSLLTETIGHYGEVSNSK
jgi:nucleoside-diphosphate-sugar epimerase